MTSFMSLVAFPRCSPLSEAYILTLRADVTHLPM